MARRSSRHQPTLPHILDQFVNRALFAEHFLRDRLPEEAEWREPDGLEATFTAIHRLYTNRAGRFVTSTNEAQTENDFIRPVLDILWSNDCYQVQVTIPGLDERRQPDYALFRTAADRDAAESRKGSVEYWRDAPVLADAKAWFAPLDRKRGSDENPSAQIANYLYRSRVRWGILTNGRVWRLYEREKSSAGGVFYEVNLEAILQHGDRQGFRYFLLFFRRQAFVPDSTGASFVEKVFQGSVDYATEVGDRLKESVYDALRLLMNGFLEHAPNGLDRHDPAALKLLHENCLIVLYRLLFLLYAEDRELLPRTTSPYSDHSLYRRQQEINPHLRAGRAYPRTTRRFWNELIYLFELIDGGLQEGGIPAYNGGLFSPTRYPHIAYTPQLDARRWDIGDHYLAQVIDMLAFQRDRWDVPGEHDIDYKTLAVQHLGSIYEGLLELQPCVADEPLVETVQGDKIIFKPVREVQNPRPIRSQPPRRIEANEVYLATNRGERKATGSFYTPKYIVDYMVENTVGPLVEQAAGKVAALRPQVDREIARWEKLRREREKAGYQHEVAKVSAAIDDQKRSLLKPYLSLRILDPAMGSGHFLVGAADFLSLAMATDPWLLPPAAAGEEDPQAYYKRLVLERCLYGLDMNILAVELAKLSLWLHTVSRDRALSFLDHHLRGGNSLVGTRLQDDLMREPPRFNAQGRRVNAQDAQLVLGFSDALSQGHLRFLLNTIHQIEELPGGDADNEHLKETLYQEIEAVRDRFRAVADCWLAPYFGAPVSPEQYERAVNALRGTRTDWEALTTEEWFQFARARTADLRCFHWELEFPELFLDEHGRRLEDGTGFHVVLGNPPYVRQELLGPLKPYFAGAFPGIYNGMADLFVYFFGQGLRQLQEGGRLAYISSNSWLQTAFAEPLRRHVRSTTTLEVLIDLGNNRTFTEAPDVCPSVFVILKAEPQEEHRFACTVFERGEKPTLSLATLSSKFTYVTQYDQPDAGWQLEDDSTRQVLAKLMAGGTPLVDVVDGQLLYGIKTGLNEAFIIDQTTRDQMVRADPECSPIIRRLARGEDLRPWYQEEAGTWVIVLPSGWTRSTFGNGLSEDDAWDRLCARFPALGTHLLPFAEAGRQRYDKGEFWWELRPCSYYDAFAKSKILWPDIANPDYSPRA